jgi:hypothetical protein
MLLMFFLLVEKKFKIMWGLTWYNLVNFTSLKQLGRLVKI